MIVNKVERASPGGTVLFCEEIRHEIYGTANYIGVLPGFHMQIPADDMPITIPKFAMSIKYYEPNETFPTYNRVEAFSPDQEDAFFSAEIEEKVIQDSRDNVTPDLPLCGFTLNVNITPFKLKSFGNITVYVSNDKERLRIGTLRISEDNDKNT